MAVPRLRVSHSFRILGFPPLDLGPSVGSASQVPSWRTCPPNGFWRLLRLPLNNKRQEGEPRHTKPDQDIILACNPRNPFRPFRVSQRPSGQIPPNPGRKWSDPLKDLQPLNSETQPLHRMAGLAIRAMRARRLAWSSRVLETLQVHLRGQAAQPRGGELSQPEGSDPRGS